MRKKKQIIYHFTKSSIFNTSTHTHSLTIQKQIHKIEDCTIKLTFCQILYIKRKKFSKETMY